MARYIASLKRPPRTPARHAPPPLPPNFTPRASWRRIRRMLNAQFLVEIPPKWQAMWTGEGPLIGLLLAHPNHPPLLLLVDPLKPLREQLQSIAQLSK